jgi:hypothetical protein
MLKRLLAVSGLLGLLAGPLVHAGVVTGNFDPPFGPALPDWSYEGSFTMNLPDPVVALAQGTPTPLVAVPDGYVPLTVSISLYETANPLNRVTQSGINLDVNLVVIDLPTGLLVNWNAVTWPFGNVAPLALTLWNAFDLDPGPGTLNHSFEFSWNSLVSGPLITCTTCSEVAAANASTVGLQLTMDQRRDNGAKRGDVLLSFGANGQATTTLFPVPSPSTLVLLAPALLGLGLGLGRARRHRRLTSV